MVLSLFFYFVIFFKQTGRVIYSFTLGSVKSQTKISDTKLGDQAKYVVDPDPNQDSDMRVYEHSCYMIYEYEKLKLNQSKSKLAP